ncbi:MAG TPA: hypothetical protein VHG91_20685, partial [Longimicrobium sp.]|nr:hypothetical protein [Longimicrobium sp.]
MATAPDRPQPDRRAVPREAPVPLSRRWPARLRSGGVRLGVLLGTAVAVYLLFPLQGTPGPVLLERGVVAEEDVIAAIAFQVPKTEEELRREQEQAASGVPPVYDYHPGAADSVVAALRGFFVSVEQGLAAAGADPQAQQRAVREALSRSGVP